VVGTNNDRPDFVARSLKLIAHPPEPVRLERSDSERVLCQDPEGSNLAHDAEELRPEPSHVRRSLPSSCHRRGLAGRASGNNVNCSARRFNRIGCHFANVAPARKARPVLLEPEATRLVDLALPDRRHASPFETEL
jgi:hypothetical protein